MKFPIQAMLVFLLVPTAFAAGTDWRKLSLQERAEWLIEGPERVGQLFETGPVDGLGAALSAAIYDCLQRGETETALELLATATELLPNDPDVLGIRGVVAALAGQDAVARELLENAVIWKQDNVLVNYNLGNLLVQSDKVADWIRGKWLLIGVLEADDLDLVERAGLTLLANLRIPLLGEEAVEIHARLDALGVFRPDNPRLPQEGRAAIARRMEGTARAPAPGD
jgi:hypothetical protein